MKTCNLKFYACRVIAPNLKKISKCKLKYALFCPGVLGRAFFTPFPVSVGFVFVTQMGEKRETLLQLTWMHNLKLVQPKVEGWWVQGQQSEKKG